MRIALASDLHIEGDRARLADMLDTRPRSVSRRYLEDRTAYMAALKRRRQIGHPQFGPDLAGLLATDLFVLAGDVDIGTAAVNYAAEAGRFLGCPVILVPGNHEYYGGDLAETQMAMREAAELAGVALLDGDRLALNIEGRRVVVLGATLWTDYAANGDPGTGMDHAGMMLADHSRIAFHDRFFRPADALQLNQAARAWLGQEAPAARQSTDVVIVATHHAPTLLGAAPQHRGSDLCPAFCSDMTAEIEEWAPDLWIFGHTHFSTSLQIGTTQLVAAQRGYLWDEPDAAHFVPYVVEI